MKKRIGIFLLLFTLLFTTVLAAGCGQKQADRSKEPAAPTTPTVKLNVAAAASLTDATKELETIYVAKHPEVKITYNLASSGTLQKQIEEGAPTDLFISASKSKMDALAEKNLIVADSRTDLLGNDLVLIAGEESTLKDVNGLTDPAIGKISIGQPEDVPAGKYAQESLTSLNLYDQLQPKIVFAKDVRQVLTYVETGNVAAGFVYKSDTYGAKNIKIVAATPEDSHKPIVYPIAVIKASKNQEAAQAFADFLASSEAATVFSKYGFTPLQK